VVQIILRVDQQIDMSVVIVNIYSLKENSAIGVCFILTAQLPRSMLAQQKGG
jgi:hypothetical protein